MMKRRLFGAVGATLILVVAGAASPTFADDSLDSTIAALIDLNPGTTAEVLVAEAAELAVRLDMTPGEVLAQQLSEAEESAAAASLPNGIVAASSGGGGNVKLGKGTRKGDIFVSSASTLFIDHGHTGIYYSTGIIVEAPGQGKKSHHINADQVAVGKGAVKQYVVTSQENRNKAANYAYGSMRNKPYNSNFANNKYVPASTYNCSQLVWGAYKKTTGIDLDANGGLGVYPYNIKDSSKTVTYKTL